MTDSGCKDSGELVYEAPELEIHKLSAIVMSGATGGGDSGFTGFNDGTTGAGSSGEGFDDDEDEHIGNPLGPDW